MIKIKHNLLYPKKKKKVYENIAVKLTIGIEDLQLKSN